MCSSVARVRINNKQLLNNCSGVRLRGRCPSFCFEFTKPSTLLVVRAFRVHTRGRKTPCAWSARRAGADLCPPATSRGGAAWSRGGEEEGLGRWGSWRPPARPPPSPLPLPVAGMDRVDMQRDRYHVQRESVSERARDRTRVNEVTGRHRGRQAGLEGKRNVLLRLHTAPQTQTTRTPPQTSSRHHLHERLKGLLIG